MAAGFYIYGTFNKFRLNGIERNVGYRFEKGNKEHHQNRTNNNKRLPELILPTATHNFRAPCNSRDRSFLRRKNSREGEKKKKRKEKRNVKIGTNDKITV